MIDIFFYIFCAILVYSFANHFLIGLIDKSNIFIKSSEDAASNIIRNKTKEKKQHLGYSNRIDLKQFNDKEIKESSIKVSKKYFNFICSESEKEFLNSLIKNYKLERLNDVGISSRFMINYVYNFSFSDKNGIRILDLNSIKTLQKSTVDIFTKTPMLAFGFLFIFGNLKPNLLKTFLENHLTRVKKSTRKTYISFTNIEYKSNIRSLNELINFYKSSNEPYLAVLSHKTKLSGLSPDDNLLIIQNDHLIPKLSILRSVLLSEKKIINSIDSEKQYFHRRQIHPIGR